MKNKRIEMPHAAHFICAPECMFRRATYINGFIVSTVGEFISNHTKKIQPVGCFPKELYETMVFDAESSEVCPVCPFVPCNFSMPSHHVRFETAKEANDAHEAFVKELERKQ